MTDNPTIYDLNTKPADDNRPDGQGISYSSQIDPVTGLKVRRPRAVFTRVADDPKPDPKGNPALYGEQSFFNKFLINMLMMLMGNIDADKPGNNPLIRLITQAFGMNDDPKHEEFRELQRDVETRGRAAVRVERNYERFNPRAAGQALSLSETQLASAATGKNIYNSPLLEMIGKHESNNDYNRVYVPPSMPGYSAVRRINASEMTLNQVLQWQSDWTTEQRKAGIPRDRCSSAFGKYQFIRSTLESTAKQMGLTGNEIMTPELQDRLAMQQLKNAGYDRFKSGQDSEMKFLNKVASIWSSIPKSTGVSAHAGIGINAAGTTVSAATATLKAERAPATSGEERVRDQFTQAGNGQQPPAQPPKPATSGETLIMSMLKTTGQDMTAPVSTASTTPEGMSGYKTRAPALAPV